MPNAAEVEKWKESFSHVMSSDGECHHIFPTYKGGESEPEQRLMGVLCHPNNFGTSCREDASLVLSEKCLSGFVEKKSSKHKIITLK